MQRLLIILFLTASQLSLALPLGSQENPVKAEGPKGEREYIMRLRCPDGSEPTFKREGSYDIGPYGNILDGYNVVCEKNHLSKIIFIDMYHNNYREMEPMDGFTIYPELPALVAKGCPPIVPGYEQGNYVFRLLEVGKRPVAKFDPREKIVFGEEGRVFAEFIISKKGTIETESIKILYSSNDKFTATAKKYLLKLEFEPAVHHPGCAVNTKVTMPVEFE